MAVAGLPFVGARIIAQPVFVVAVAERRVAAITAGQVGKCHALALQRAPPAAPPTPPSRPHRSVARASALIDIAIDVEVHRNDATDGVADPFHPVGREVGVAGGVRRRDVPAGLAGALGRGLLVVAVAATKGRWRLGRGAVGVSPRRCSQGRQSAPREPSHRAEQGTLHCVGILDIEGLVHDVAGGLLVAPRTSPMALLKTQVRVEDRAQLREHSITYGRHWGGAVKEAAKLRGMAMHVQKHVDAFVGSARSDVSDVLLQGVDDRVDNWVRVVPHSVRVDAGEGAPRVAMNDAVDVDHRHDMEYVCLPKGAGGWRWPKDELKEALDGPRPDHFAGMLSRDDDNHRQADALPPLTFSLPLRPRVRFHAGAFRCHSPEVNVTLVGSYVLRDHQEWHWQLPDGPAQLRAHIMRFGRCVAIQLGEEPRHHGVCVRREGSKVYFVVRERHTVRPRQRVLVRSAAVAAPA
mmetsp:Transcript_75777/g.218800  ORF Transcript_75777/g.218800 Transcript_75777/m.218800 type:complete len:464 (-) Transcript_75777:54-1445(-)